MWKDQIKKKSWVTEKENPLSLTMQISPYVGKQNGLNICLSFKSGL
jgi:hypothetical protein